MVREYEDWPNDDLTVVLEAGRDSGTDDDPQLERGIAWNDPDVAIDWPLPADELIVSARDSAAPLLRELADELPFEFGAG